MMNSVGPLNRPPLSIAVSSRRGLRLAAVSDQGESRFRNPSDHIFSLENLQSALPGARATKQEQEEALNAHGHETNFEMNREIEMSRSSTSLSASEEKKTVECFSLNLDDFISKNIVEDIEKIVFGEYKEPEECPSESEVAAEKSDSTELIKQLETIAMKYGTK
ncbi:unnamed protein product [Hymenolepis diminuta]|uniref:DUF1716 domain-containing protein n=1 Tax=Hymenolepis diminuta TaxID=6216 RepID=A0A0R3SVQ6_HYMDI|nr:unnamed protein product [Hymenolepis diminuta]